MPRPRTPTEVKRVTGIPGRVGINKREPKPVSPLTAAPEWMTDEQRGAWEYGLREAPAGVLSSLDLSIYAVYAIAAAAHKEAAMLCASKGLVILTSTGTMIQAPWVGMMNKQATVLIRVCGELGFTPASRSKVSVAGSDEEPKDPAAKFFN